MNKSKSMEALFEHLEMNGRDTSKHLIECHNLIVHQLPAGDFCQETQDSLVGLHQVIEIVKALEDEVHFAEHETINKLKGQVQKFENEKIALTQEIKAEQKLCTEQAKVIKTLEKHISLLIESMESTGEHKHLKVVRANEK